MMVCGPHNHEPIVDEMMFELVQRMLQRDTRKSPGGNGPAAQRDRVLRGLYAGDVPSRGEKGEHAFTIMCSSNKADKGMQQSQLFSERSGADRVPCHSKAN